MSNSFRQALAREKKKPKLDQNFIWFTFYTYLFQSKNWTTSVRLDALSLLYPGPVKILRPRVWSRRWASRFFFFFFFLFPVHNRDQKRSRSYSLCHSTTLLQYRANVIDTAQIIWPSGGCCARYLKFRGQRSWMFVAQYVYCVRFNVLQFINTVKVPKFRECTQIDHIVDPQDVLFMRVLAHDYMCVSSDRIVVNATRRSEDLTSCYSFLFLFFYIKLTVKKHVFSSIHLEAVYFFFSFVWFWISLSRSTQKCAPPFFVGTRPPGRNILSWISAACAGRQ